MKTTKLKQNRDLDREVPFRLRTLLEDFEIIAGHTEYMLLISKHVINETLLQNLQAAIIATKLHLKSLDYAKKTYCKPNIRISKNEKRADIEYTNSYLSVKEHINKEFSRFDAGTTVAPSFGVFGASIALERLVSSFFSAHLLYKLGNSYEAHSVSRLILEQIAWAYTVYSLESLDDIEKINTTKTISNLKKIIPESGNLYGFLSKKTHIDYWNHREFVSIEEETNMILLSKNDWYEFTEIILTLADLFGIVWEISQFDYMSKTESVKKVKGSFIVKQNRPFRKVITKHLANLEKLESFKS